MIKFVSIIAILLASLSVFARSNNWINASSQGHNGLNVLINFQGAWIDSPSALIKPRGAKTYQLITKPTWVNVHLSGLKQTDKVEFTIVNWVNECLMQVCHKVAEYQIFELDFAEKGRFTKKLDSISLKSRLYDNGKLITINSLYQKVFLRVNNRVLTPENGLSFNLLQNYTQQESFSKQKCTTTLL